MTALKILFYRLTLKIRLFLTGKKTRAVILDRDGTLNRDPGYVIEPEDLELFPETIPALKKLFSAGWLLVIISNQSGVGRGYFTLGKVKKFNRHLLAILADAGIFIAKIYVCPHRPDEGCLCRKPGTLLFEKAIREFRIDRSRSYGIGDRETDAEAAEKTGLKAVRLGEDFNNLLSASNSIISESARRQ